MNKLKGKSLRQTKKEANDILIALKEKVPIGTSKITKTLSRNYPRSSKVRRHSGRRFPKIFKPQMKWSQVIKEALEPNSIWNDWLDYRDSMRAIWSEKFREYHCRKSNKIRKEVLIRKAKLKGKIEKW